MCLLFAGSKLKTHHYFWEDVTKQSFYRDYHGLFVFSAYLYETSFPLRSPVFFVLMFCNPLSDSLV